ncbi:MAG: YigZ family protein [Clostridia bacterium]|nr:YigZ family protein [Clostridia bacterium]
MAENGKRITLLKAAQAEIEEKKSIFIGYAAPVSSEEEAKAIVAAKKKEFSDATHNVWAYYLDGGIHVRYSDDGEPQGTAGIPVLNVLKMSGATDMVVVVTRYFGGTLLGAGGLVRAYSASAKAALDAAGFAYMENYTIFSLTTNYSDYQRLADKLPKMGAVIDDTDFGGDVTLTIAIESTRKSEIAPVVSEITNGKGVLDIIGVEERASRV